MIQQAKLRLLSNTPRNLLTEEEEEEEEEREEKKGSSARLVLFGVGWQTNAKQVQHKLYFAIKWLLIHASRGGGRFDQS